MIDVWEGSKRLNEPDIRELSRPDKLDEIVLRAAVEAVRDPNSATTQRAINSAIQEIINKEPQGV